jgi:sugar phosphate isomerase/epimerase
MALTRREWIAAAAGALPAAAQQPVPSQPPRRRPMLCLFSKHLQQLPYIEIGSIMKQLGFEGCDLTVRAGGHVIPEKSPVDLSRAIESIRGDGVEVAMITTDLTSPLPYTARLVLGISGRMGVPFFKPGYWRYTAADIETRITEVRREAAGLVALGRAYGIAAGFHNHSGDYVGEAIWDTRAIIADLDPRWAGYYFDPGHATAEGGVAGWNIALRLALTRLKMVALKDFFWEKSAGKWQKTDCPMGQGMVEWPKVFAMLAAAKFTGPLSLHIEYNPADELTAIARDLAFVKKQVEVAYGRD